MTPQIKPYEEKDLDEILDIINFYILNTTAIYDYEARTKKQQSIILKEKFANHFPFLVARIESKIVGFGTYGSFRFKKAYQFTVEHSVYIHPKYQGFGVGKLLLTALILLAKKQKIHTMIAVIDSGNQHSVDFHKNFGFETVGIIKESGFKFEKWLDSIFMQLILS